MKSFKEYILTESGLKDTFISVFQKGETNNLTKEQIIDKIIEFQKNHGCDSPKTLKNKIEKKFDETMEDLGYTYKKEENSSSSTKEENNSKDTSLYNMAKAGHVKDVLSKTEKIKQEFKNNEEIQNACKKVQDEAPKAASAITEDNELATTGDNTPSEPSEQIRQEFLNACKKLDDLLIKKGDNLSLQDNVNNDNAQVKATNIFKEMLESDKYKTALASLSNTAAEIINYAAELNEKGNKDTLDEKEIGEILKRIKKNQPLERIKPTPSFKAIVPQLKFLISCLALKHLGSNLFTSSGTVAKEKGLTVSKNIDDCLKTMFNRTKKLGSNILNTLGKGLESSDEFAGSIDKLFIKLLNKANEDDSNKNDLAIKTPNKGLSDSNNSDSNSSAPNSSDSNSSAPNNSDSNSSDSNSSDSNSSDSNNSDSNSSDSNSSAPNNSDSNSSAPNNSDSNSSSGIRKISTGIGAIKNLSYRSTEKEIKDAVNDYYGTGDGEEERGKLYDYYSSEMDKQMKINDELYKRNQALNPLKKQKKEEKVEENLILYNIHNNKLLTENDFTNKIKDTFTFGKYDLSQSKTSGSYNNYKSELAKLISAYRKKVNNEVDKIGKIASTDKKAGIIYKIKKITNSLEDDATQLFYRAKKANSYNVFGMMQHNHNINAKRRAEKAKEVFDNSRAGKLSNIVKEKIQEVMKNLTPEMLDKIPDDEQGTKNGFRDTVAYVVKNFTSDSKFNAILNEPDIDNQINDKGTVKQHAIEAIQAVEEFNVAGEAEVMAFLGELVNKMKEDKAINAWIEKYNKVYEDKKLKLPLKQTIFALGDDKKRTDIINKIKSSTNPINDIESSFGITTQTQVKKPEYNNPEIQREIVSAANTNPVNTTDQAVNQSVKTESVLHISFKDYLLREQELIGQNNGQVNNGQVNNDQGKQKPGNSVRFTPEQLPLLAFLLLVSGNAQGDLYAAALKNLTGSGKDNSQYSDEDKIRALNMWKREHEPMVQKITETMNTLLKKAASVVTSAAVGDCKIPSRLFKQTIRRKIGKTL